MIYAITAFTDYLNIDDVMWFPITLNCLSLQFDSISKNLENIRLPFIRSIKIYATTNACVFIEYFSPFGENMFWITSDIDFSRSSLLSSPETSKPNTGHLTVDFFRFFWKSFRFDVLNSSRPSFSELLQLGSDSCSDGSYVSSSVDTSSSDEDS